MSSNNSGIHQHKRNKLYLPNANGAVTQPAVVAADYDNYKKETAFRRLVSGAVRRPSEGQRPRPDFMDTQSKRQTISAAPEVYPPQAAEVEKKRRSHRQSTIVEVDNQPPPPRVYDYGRPLEDRRRTKDYSRRPGLNPLSSNPPERDDERAMYEKARNRSAIDARRPDTTERLSRHSKRSRRRER